MTAGGCGTAALRLRRLDARDGERVVPYYDLALAEGVAAALASGAGAALVASLLPRTAGDLLRTILRRRPDRVVIAAGTETEAAARLLAGRLDEQGTPTVLDLRPEDPDSAASPALAAGAWLTRAEARAPTIVAGDAGLPRADAPSPYRAAGVPAEACEHIGVRLAWQVPGTAAPVLRAPDEIVADLQHLDARVARPVVVPLVGAAALLDGGASAQLAELGRGWSRLRPSWTLPLASAEAALRGPEPLRGGRLRVVVPAARGTTERLVRLQLAAGACDVTLEPLVRPEEAGDDVAALRAVIRAMPATEVQAPAGVLARLEAAGAAADASPAPAWWSGVRAGRRRALARVSRCASGRYDRDDVIADAAREVRWEHPEDPWSHARWLGDVLGTGGLLVQVVGEGGAAAEFAGHARTLALRAGQDGDLLRLSGPGLAVAEAPYRSARERLPDEPTVLRLDGPADLQAFLEDADAAARGDALPPGLLHPLTLVADACALGAVPCAGPRLARLVVDPNGAVRTGLAGTEVGRLGDPLPGIRSAAVKLAGNALGCSCIPRDWPAGALSDLATRAWIPLLLAAKGAVKTLSGERPELGRAEGLSSVRLLGTGEPIGSGNWPPGLALVAVGERAVLHEGSSARAVWLSVALARVVARLLARGPEEARRLAGELATAPEVAEQALAGAGAALRRVGVTVPAQHDPAVGG